MSDANRHLQYCLSADVQTSPLDVSSGTPVYLVEVGGAQRFEVTAGVHRVVELLSEGPQSVPGLVDRLRREGSESATSDKLSWLIQSVLLPRRIAQVAGDDESVDPSSADGAGEPRDAVGYQPVTKRSSYLWAKIPLAGPETLSPLTRVLSPLFHPWLAVPIFAAALAVYAYFYLVVLQSFTWSLESLSVAQGVTLLAVLNLTTIFHELGHVSACRYFGSSHGKVGWGIYLFMFVLYADVSQIWRLKRWQRAIVDIGGMYFEVIATLIIFGLLLWTGEPLFIYLFLFVNLSIVTSLNPVLRRDGYWILTDLAGQANLRDANMDALRYALRRLTGRNAGWRPALFDKPKWLQVTVLLYSAISVLFSVWLVWWISGRLVAEVIPAAVALPQEIRDALHHGSLLSWTLISAVGSLAFQGLFLVIVAMAAWSLGSSLVKAVFVHPAEDYQGGGGVRAEWKGAP